jgi:selenide,water dikinase
VRVRLDASALPALPGALPVAAAGERTGGDRRNREFAGPHVRVEGVPEATEALAYDPQTAGGLLVALPADRAVTLQAAFAARGLFLARVGLAEEGDGVVLGGA